MTCIISKSVLTKPTRRHCFVSGTVSVAEDSAGFSETVWGGEWSRAWAPGPGSQLIAAYSSAGLSWGLSFCVPAQRVDRGKHTALNCWLRRCWWGCRGGCSSVVL